MANQVWYKIERSRNGGRFWSHLIGFDTISLEKIRVIYKNEIEKHPSDWIRIVKCEESSVEEHLGNKKRNKQGNK